MTRVTTAMVLAAGFGKRMRPLTLTCPKPLATICGRPLIDHVLDRLAAVGVRSAVVNTHHLGDQIAAHLSPRVRPNIVLSPEAEILETGGGLVNALKLLGPDPIYVVNADTYWLDGLISALERLARHWDDQAYDALLLLQRTVSAVGYDGPGDFFCDPLGRPTRRKPGQVSPFLYSGIQILHPRVLAGRAVEPFSLNLIWDQLIEAGRIGAVIHDGLWFAISSTDDLAATEAYLDENRLTPVARPVAWPVARPVARAE